ncbi:hypothetical protein AAC387_Pa11g0110 [Persea americana]
MGSSTNKDNHFFTNHQQMNQPSRPSSSSADSSFPILAIAVLGILATAFLLLFYYVFVIKCCFNRQRPTFVWRFSGSLSRRREEQLIIYAPTIENRGLDESVIRAIPIIQFKKIVAGREGDEKSISECAVCLNEFQEEERLRLLPNCSHAFHIDCIDTWLQSNANCPLCRSSVSNASPFSRGLIMAQNPYQDPPQFTINQNGDVVIELSGDGTADQASRSQDVGSSMEIPVQSVATQHNTSPKKLEQRALPKKPRRFNHFHHLSSMGDECIDVRGKDDQFSIQPIRRSFSMDSSADRQLYLSVQEILQQNSNLHEFSTAEESSRVRRSFFSFGHGRRSRNAVLPIQFEQ